MANEGQQMTEMPASTFAPEQHLRLFKGQQYLDVKWRLMWLRQEHPDATIATDLVQLDLDQRLAVFKAAVSVPSLGSATGYGSETEKDFPRAGSKKRKPRLSAARWPRWATGRNSRRISTKAIMSSMHRSTRRRVEEGAQRPAPLPAVRAALRL